MPLSLPFDSGFFEGGSVSDLVPGQYPVAIDGNPYLVDLKSGAFKRQSIPILRQQADNSNQPGEASINPEDLWRRAEETWHHGAGQDYLDRGGTSLTVFSQTAITSDAARFNKSKGIDVWTRWQLSLLNDTERKTPTTTNANQNLVVAGAYLYWGDGTTLRRTTDPTVSAPSWTTITGTGANPILSLASDGFDVWAAQGSNGVYATTTGGTTASHLATGNAGVVGYVKDRLMVAGSGVDKHRIWNIDNYSTPATFTTGATGVYPDPLYSHNNTDFTWVGFAEGLGSLYAAGYSGDKSLIYRTAIKATGATLDVPVVAGELPDGEIVRSIQGYLGFLVIGTDQGVRFASADSSGNLTLGSLIKTNSSVQCFEPQDRFVWFGWTNYDGTSTGLGRLDLTSFIDPLTPAHASDLMVSTQGTVTSIATFGNRRYFTVSTYGLVGELSNLVTSGTLDSGKITFGIPDVKVSMFIQGRHSQLNGSVAFDISFDGGPFVNVGLNNVTQTTETSVPTGQQTGVTFEVRTTLTRGTVTTGPILYRVTLRSYPAPARGRFFMVPLLLHESIELDGGYQKFLNPQTELDRIETWIRDHQLVLYQEGSSSFSVFVEDFEWTPHNETADGTFWNGTCVVKLKSVTE